MHIAIRYLAVGSNTPASRELTPADYFEPPLQGEADENVNVPRHNHARDYLPSNLAFQWTELTVSGDGESYTIREVFGPGESFFWHRVDADGYQELGMHTALAPNQWHVERLVSDRSQPWRMAYSGLISQQPDGSESEDRLW